jgi:hypothetical protein
VKPDAGLTDGQKVSIDGQGFDLGDDVEVATCEGLVLSQGLGACDGNTAAPIDGASPFATTGVRHSTSGWTVTKRSAASRLLSPGSALLAAHAKVASRSLRTVASDTAHSTYAVSHQIATDAGDNFDCTNGNVDPAGFAALTPAQQHDVLAPGSGWQTCVVVVQDFDSGLAGYAPIAFAGEVFKALPAVATAPVTPATPAAPATAVTGTSHFTG